MNTFEFVNKVKILSKYHLLFYKRYLYCNENNKIIYYDDEFTKLDKKYFPDILLKKVITFNKILDEYLKSK